jgi:hypothetical protein
VLLSAFHNQLTGKHTSKEKSDRNKDGKAFFGIFPDYKPEETPVETLEITDKECLQLWRFILRLNSTKIEPSSWQKKHLPLGENSHDDHSHHCGAMVVVSPLKQKDNSHLIASSSLRPMNSIIRRHLRVSTLILVKGLRL